ncbi:hypothetical protein MNBD_GAMMA12-2429 [hydrothermal vent metagenome]|uniref:Uncharacterized protein n=1 Tax=hydrothermal vent metagenome TaxID=652676 RepID=A0A3B0Y6G4_9ZZZZ
MFNKIKNKIINFSNFIGNNCFLSCHRDIDISPRKKIYVYSMGWGDFLEYYFKYTVPSIYQPSNLPLLESEGFEIIPILYTIDEPDKIYQSYGELITKYLPDNFCIEQIKLQTVGLVKHIANEAILRVFRKSIDENALFIMAPPDTIFSDGSIYNAVKSVYYKSVCFGSAHPRVKFDLLEDQKIKTMACGGESISSPTMVKLAMTHLHDKYLYANDELDENTTYAGVSIRKINDELYSVIHNLPTTYVVYPLEEDYQFFKRKGDFNQWDREWLQLLVKKNRIKISGASDQFFCVELTSKDEKAKTKPGLKGNDIAGNSFQNRICNMVNVTWRAE